MRTTLDIDDVLLQTAMQAGGFKTKKETVEAGLRMLAQCRSPYRELLKLSGNVDWDHTYNHKAMR